MNIFNGMDRHNCKPDAITYSVIISAYDRGGEWSRALQVNLDSSLDSIQPVKMNAVELGSRSG